MRRLYDVITSYVQLDVSRIRKQQIARLQLITCNLATVKDLLFGNPIDVYASRFPRCLA
jgi:hypothetical protein